MEVTQALFSVKISKASRILGANIVLIALIFKASKMPIKFTHKKPVAKTPIIKSLLFKDICRFQTVGIGSMRIAKSDNTLKTPLAFHEAVASKQ